MRITGGRHRGRPLRVPGIPGLRPAADRVRESLFNILTHGSDWPGLEGASVVDVFAGTGAYGLEAISRGAAHAAFIDSDRGALLAIRRNAASLGEAGSMIELKLDATRLPPPPRLAQGPCQLAFLDPPYESGFAVPALQGLAMRGWLAEDGIAIAEVAAREPLEPPRQYVCTDERIYGAARLVFLRRRR